MDGGKPVGIVVHSTGCNNPNLKRYVQPSKTDPDYKTIIADLGINKYNNSHNDPNGTVCVNAYIGKNKNGDVVVYECLPGDYCCYGVGYGSKGSYNYNPTAHYQFEICEDDLNDPNYFAQCYAVATEYCAVLCKRFGLTPYNILSHKETHAKGYGSNHGDPDHWLKKYGLSMDSFRSTVKNKLATMTDNKIYRVQTGAFKIKENAEKYVKELNKKGIECFIVEVNTNDT